MVSPLQSLCIFCKYFHGNSSYDPFTLVPRLHVFKRATGLTYRSHPFVVELATFNRDFCLKNVFSLHFLLSNPPPFTWVPDNYNRQKLKCNVNRHLLYFCPFLYPPYLHFSLTFISCNSLLTSGIPALLGLKSIKCSFMNLLENSLTSLGST